MTLRMTIVVLTVLALAACAAEHKREVKSHDASNYNMQLGMAYLGQNELALAKEKLERAVAENPGDPNVHSAMAQLEDRLGHPDKADSEFKTALRLAPHEPAILNNYAVYLCRTGRTDEGVKAFETAAHDALYRTPEVAYTNAGVCLHGAKRDTQAAMAFQRALLIKPNFGEAAYQLASLDFERGELLEAKTTVAQYVDSYEATADLLLLGARIAHKTGDRSTEEKYSRRLRLDFPGSDQARTLAAELSHNPG
jgi:type IV pilus assembly protein PilF